MAVTQSSVGSSSPDGRSEESGDRHLGLVERLDQHADGGGVATGSILADGGRVGRPPLHLGGGEAP